MPSGTQKEIRGAAARLTLSAGITPASGACQANGSVAGWPSGVGGISFVIAIDPGLPIMEKILCATLAGSAPATITFVTRGYDGTTAQQHDANAIVAHGLDADTQMNFMAHIYDETRDDHPQYVPVDGSRGFDAITSSLADVPVSLGTANAEGTSLHLARADHVHKIGAAAINVRTMFDATAIRPVIYAGSAPASPAVGDIWFNTTTGRMKVYYGATTLWQPPWDTAWGEVPSGYAEVSAEQAGIGDTHNTDVTGLSVTITAIAGRLYELTWFEPFWLGSGETDQFHMKIYVDGAMTQFVSIAIGPNNLYGRQLTVTRRRTLTAGSHTIKAVIDRHIGGSGLTLTRAPAFNGDAGPGYGYIQVRDIGPNADPALV